MSKEAERYYKTGPPFLRRYLPFWLATYIERAKVMLVPLIALFFPFFKLMPMVYRWHKNLAEVDPQLQKDDMAAHLDEYLTRLNHIEAQVCQT